MALANSLGEESQLILSATKRTSAHEEITAAAAQRGVQVTVFVADLSTPQGVDELVKRTEEICEEEGGLHGLVNVAGLTLEKGLKDVTPNDFQQLCWLNVGAPIFLCQGLSRQMARVGGASVVNYGSAQSIRVFGGTELYGITKDGNNATSRQLAVALGPLGIRVNTLIIGWAPVERHYSQPGFDPIAEGANFPIRRLLSPADVTNTALFLLSPYSAGITGAEINVTGGQELRAGAGK
jgi:3-oxoacyl-[acyl-carrier protein] reductase